MDEKFCWPFTVSRFEPMGDALAILDRESELVGNVRTRQEGLDLIAFLDNARNDLIPADAATAVSLWWALSRVPLWSWVSGNSSTGAFHAMPHDGAILLGHSGGRWWALSACTLGGWKREVLTVTSQGYGVLMHLCIQLAKKEG